MRLPFLPRASPDPMVVRAAVAAAVTAIPGVVAESIGFNRQPYASSALTGVVDLGAATREEATPMFDAVLGAATRALVDQLGGAADRVTIYLAGRLSDGTPITPGDLGTAQPPTGTELRRRYLA